MVKVTRAATRTSGGFIPEGFDETVNYRVQLDKLEERQATYPGAKPGEMSLVWHLRVFDEDNVAFIDPGTGDPWDLWEWSEIEGMYSNPTTGKKSKSWAFAEAFMGQELSDEDMDDLNDDGWENELVGKYALASFELRTGNDGNPRARVLKLRPYSARRSRRNGDA